MEEEWFIKIFNLYIDDVYRLAFSYTHNKEDTDDITQKVFLEFYNNIFKIGTDEEKIKKWLIVTTINECKDLFKTAWKKKIITLNEDIIYHKNLVENKVEIENEFQYYLKELKPKYRIIFYLYYYYGYDTNEVAKLLKIKESTVRQRLARGRQILKIEKEVENEGF